jgi:mannose-6-phosphate isomerase-like protein (cupin superfamily)
MLIVEKGWGYEKWITNTEKYCGKLLHFEEGKRCSWHFHKIKDEVFYVQSGELEVIFGESDSKAEASILILRPGDSFHVPTGLRHQMKAIKTADVFEISTEHFEEDSYRIEKGD